MQTVDQEIAKALPLENRRSTDKAAGLFRAIKALHFPLGMLGGLLLAGSGWLTIVDRQNWTPSNGSFWHQEVYQIKEAQLTATEMANQRLIVVSGSNALFGIRSEQLEKTLNIPVINYAGTGDLDLGYLLERTSRHLQKGDHVLMPIEYGCYTWDGQLSRTSVDLLRSCDHVGWQQRSFAEKWRLATKSNPREWIKELTDPATPQWPATRWLQEQAITKRGDISANSEQDRAAMTEGEQNARTEAMALGWAVDSTAEEVTITASSGRALTDFIDQCRAVGARPLATFQSILSHPAYTQPLHQALFRDIAAFYRNQGVAVIGSPADFMVDEEQIFDARSHLTHEAALERTEVLGRMLLQQFQIPPHSPR